MTTPSPAGRPLGTTKRLLLFLVGALLWTLVSSYPNPLIFFRNLARYRRLPIDPRLAQRMRWQVPPKVEELETFADGLLTSAPDWQLYRVPWYVPTPVEAARAGSGDCEARMVILASLLREKGIPFEVRASLHHIWVDYAGRLPQPGESSDDAYLTVKGGKVELRWPRRLRWREMMAAQKAQLWDAMPAVRKAIWIYGLAWLALALLVSGRPSPAGDLVSDWRTPWRPYLARAAAVSVLAVAAMAVAALLSHDAGEWTSVKPKEGVALKEALAYFVVFGGLLAWLSVLRAQTAVMVGPEGTHLACQSLFAGIRRERTLPVSSISHLTLEASPGGLRPWVVAAVMTGKPARRPADKPASLVPRPRSRGRDGGPLKAGLATGQAREPLLRYRAEVSARAALRRLGSRLGRPIVVRCEGAETRTEPEEIGLGLRQRACRAGLPLAEQARPAGQASAAAPAALRGTGLRMSETEGGWELGYTPLAREATGTLLGCAAVPVAITALSTALLVYRADLAAARVMWALAAFLLAATTYLALALRDEFFARLVGTRVEIAMYGDRHAQCPPASFPGSAGVPPASPAPAPAPGGEFRFHSAEDKVETLRLADIETVEPGRVGETATIAVVTPERVLHMAGLGQPEEREWVMEAIRSAIARFTGRVGGADPAPSGVDKPARAT